MEEGEEGAIVNIINPLKGCPAHAEASDAEERKAQPVYSGVIKYFPNALLEVSKVSHAGGAQHNPGKPLFWDRSKSGDELDAMMRHLIDHTRGVKFDECGTMHLAKCAWRILAYLEKEVENEK